jgi:glutamate dehydrogenase
MAAEGLLGTEDERAARHLVEAASGLLAAHAGVPKNVPPKTFLAHLFGGAVAEDLLRYTAAELAAFAASTWDFAGTRKPGAPKIRFERLQDATGERSRQVSVVEILNDDMPFLVDSVMGELTEHGLEARLVVHPVFTVERDGAGRLTNFRTDAPPIGGALRESLIHIHVELVQDEVRRTEIVQALEQVLANVRVCVADWRPMLARVGETIAELKTNPPPLPVDEIAETIQFLEWLVGNNFTFLGVRDYVLTDKEHALDPVFESGLGLLRSHELRVMRRGEQLLDFTPEIRAFLAEPRPLIITKATIRSRVHRRVYMDYVGVKRFDAEGNLVGEFRILGLFTSTAYIRSTRSIPYLRRKVQAVVTRARFDPEGHNGKALVNVLESYPRDELFQLDEDTLFHFALAILQLDERPRVRVLARRDRFDRFVSVLVFVPRDRYDSHTRRAIGDYLSEVYKGRVSAFYPFFPEGPLVRVHFIIGLNEGETPSPDRATLEHAVGNIVRTWIDELSEALGHAHDPAKARTLLERYREAFSDGYREAYSPLVALEDIRVIEGLSAGRPLGVDFHRRAWDATAQLGLKVYSYSRPIPLSERVPVLENMGVKVVDERTYHITPPDPSQSGVWLHDMLLERQDGAAIDFENVQRALEASFLVTMSGGAENDGYNALVLAGGLMWRDVALIRALSRFLRQIRVAFSQDYMWATLRKHAGIATRIVQLFHTRFDPRAGITLEQRRADEGKVVAEIEAALQAVESLDEDRILRHFVNAVQSALRTNFFQLDADGRPKSTITVKYDSRKLDGLPLPRPLYEIYVYSPRVEGVHLRFGKVARGE